MKTSQREMIDAVFSILREELSHRPITLFFLVALFGVSAHLFFNYATKQDLHKVEGSLESEIRQQRRQATENISSIESDMDSLHVELSEIMEINLAANLRLLDAQICTATSIQNRERLQRIRDEYARRYRARVGTPYPLQPECP